MRTVTVPALKAFAHFQPGDPVTVPPAEAAALARKGLVSLTKTSRTSETAAIEPHSRNSPSREDAPRRRRTYRRRDMTAEQP